MVERVFVSPTSSPERGCPVNVSGSQIERIHEALLSAYVNHAQLAMMVRFKLDGNLNRIGGNGPMEEVVFKLVQWAEARGKLNVLIDGAASQNPGNPQLTQLQELWEEWHRPEPPAASLNPVPSNASLQATNPHQPFEPEMVLIPAGPFLMGSDPLADEHAGDNEFPQHVVPLPDFYMAKTPVTNVQYAAFVRSTNYKAPRHWPDGSLPRDKAQHPVVWVSWRDAVAYCQWLSEVTGRRYRLPTEAEWEKAARGTDGRLYPWGNEPPDAKRLNYDGSGIKDTTEVGSYPPGLHGLYDMAGNVWEWCSTLRQSYPYRSDDGREDPDAKGFRVLRGGSYWSSADRVRCAARDVSGNVYIYLGFRVVLLK